MNIERIPSLFLGRRQRLAIAGTLLQNKLNRDLYPIAHNGQTHCVAHARVAGQIVDQIIEIFGRLGYTISEGPEIEDDWHVFSSLNFPPEHPARDMQDTFFIEKDPDILLRTHTSSHSTSVGHTREHMPPMMFSRNMVWADPLTLLLRIF